MGCAQSSNAQCSAHQRHSSGCCVLQLLVFSKGAWTAHFKCCQESCAIPHSRAMLLRSVLHGRRQQALFEFFPQASKEIYLHGSRAGDSACSAVGCPHSNNSRLSAHLSALSKPGWQAGLTRQQQPYALLLSQLHYKIQRDGSCC